MVKSPTNVKLIQCKKLWQIVSGIHYATEEKVVYQELSSIEAELLNGIKHEKNSTTNIETRIDDTLLPFIDKLKQFLDVDQEKAWTVFCCYLENEFNDSIELIRVQQQNFLKTESNMEKLLNQIWNYYSLERMTLLKIVKNILEQSRSPKHPYAKEYERIVHQIGLGKLRKSYIEQLTQLIRQPAPFKPSHGELFNVRNKLVSWTERRLRETNEILQILLLIVHRDDILVDEFKLLVELFKQHSFGRQQPYLDLTANNVHKDLVVKITYNEVSLFLLCVEERVIDNSMKISENSNIDRLRTISKQMDKDIVLLHQNPEHGPILLSWMLMNFQLIELRTDSPEFIRFQQYGTKAAKLGVFTYLHKLISHPMYRDQSLTALITYQTVFNMLSFMCEIFDNERAITQHKNIFELFCELLKHQTIAAKFHSNPECGAQSLFNTAIHNFPVDFIPLSMIAYSLTTTTNAMSSYIRRIIEDLPTYTEYYDAERIALRASDCSENEYVLANEFIPFSQKIGYNIPGGTVATITDKPEGTQVHFQTSLNFFNVLHHEINELLSDLIKRPEIDIQRKNRVYWGLKYLACAVRRISQPHEISSEMVHPTEMVFDIFFKLKDVPNPPVDLLAQCFQVCTALVPMHQTEIFKRVINLDILPFCTNDKLKFDEYANGAGFDTGLVGDYLVSFEKVVGKYEFLSAYLEFLKIFATQSQMDCTVSLELPGLIFLLREVLPYIHTWRFENEVDRQRIMTEILQHFCNVLNIPDDAGARLILRNTCVYSLLYLDSGLTLLRIVSMGNSYIEEVMQNETNWMTAEKTSFNLLVQLGMTILMHVLRLRYRLTEKTTMSPLENVIYAQPKHVIPVVTGYMRNIFNRRLPILSCRLLRRFAIEFQMSLFSCLDMEPSQIRSTFLERLENEFEREELKIGVLEFVEACIEKQPGMTEAFFKISYDDRKVIASTSHNASKNKDISEGVLTYMKLYLIDVGEKSNIFVEISDDDIPLLTQIMSLFHSLWKNNMQQLVEKLLNEPDFWKSILNPLFGNIKPGIRVYSQLFNMIGLELYRITETKNINENLKSTLNRLLDRSVFFKWVNNVLNIPNEMDIVSDETPDWLNRLQSFKDMFVIIMRRKDRHGIDVPNESLQYFGKQCLNSLTERLNYTDDMRPFIIFAELYLSLLFSYKNARNSSVFDDSAVLPNINLILNQLAGSYGEMHIRAKESILAIAFRAIELFAYSLNDNTEITMSFIDSIVHILCYELMDTENDLRAKVKAGNGRVSTDRRSLSFILSLNIFKVILKDFDNSVNGSRIERMLQIERVFNRILSCLYVTLPLHCARKLSTEMLDLLIAFANSRFSVQLLYCDLDYYLWMKLLPPKELVQASYSVPVTSSNSVASPLTWQSHEWWPIYSLGIQLVQNLLQYHGHLFTREAISFVGVHEEFLMDSLLLAKHALNETPARLIKNALELVSKLITYEKQWRLEHQQSMINLMRCVQILLDHAVSLLYRPKFLKRLVNNTGIIAQSILKDIQNTNDDDTFEDEVKAMNVLVEIVTICSKCLMAFSPSLQELLTSPEFLPTKWQPLVEIQFNAPKLNVGSTVPQLTFGTILNAAIIFTKALTVQQFKFDEHPLNILETFKTNDTNKSVYSSPLTQSTINTSKQRNYTTSISALSTASVSAATTNEYLINLDAEQCLLALELILTLLASQSLLALKDINLSQREKQLIKRELSTELSIFYDFVKKRVLPEVARDDPLRRKKHGMRSMEINQESDDSNRQQSAASSGLGRKSISNSDRMRINVTRKLHLQSAISPSTSTSPGLSGRSPFNMTHQYSPIPNESSGSITRQENFDLPSSTPAPERSGITSMDDSDIDEDQNDGVQLYFEPEDPSYCELSFVQLIEEDYLHFLSNLFGFICHTDKIN